MLLEALEGEPMVQEFKPFLLGTRMPDSLRYILTKLWGDRRSFLLGSIRKCAQRQHEAYHRATVIICEGRAPTLTFPNWCLLQARAGFLCTSI